MVRQAVVAASALALAVSGCSKAQYQSAVDMAPYEARAATSPVAEGLYCPVTVMWRRDGEPILVMAGEENDHPSCVRYHWDKKRRLVLADGLEGKDGDPPEKFEAAAAPLGEGLFALQSTNNAAEAAKAARFTISLALVSGEAIGQIEPLPAAAMLKLAARHPGAEVNEIKTSDADDAAGPVFIRSGPREDVAELLKDAARLSLKQADSPGAIELAILVRVDDPKSLTVRNVLKRSDLEKLRKLAVALADRAPTGVSASSETSDMP